MKFSGMRVLIVGLGISNISVAKYLADKNLAQLVITDSKDINELQGEIQSVQSAYPSAEFKLNGHNEVTLDKIDLVVKSPSISNNSEFIQQVIKRKIPIETDISLFIKIITPQKIIGITGTKGKSTTSSLIYESLKGQNVNAVICGNIGIPVFDEIYKAQTSEWVVMELSSYMIVSLHEHNLSPHVAVFTTFSPDHIDYHGSYENYIGDKLKLFAFQNKQDAIFANADDSEVYQKVRPQNLVVNFYSRKDIESIIETSLRGNHYKSNIAAAFKVTKFITGSAFDFTKFHATIKHFKTLSSRMETVGIVNKIEYINNSKATNPGAFSADLTTLIEENKDIYILGGGADKELDLTTMAELINHSLVKKIALINDNGSIRLSRLIDKTKITGYFQNIKDAFESIQNIIEKQAVVVLMPGTSTYGLFKNKVGSDDFNSCVMEIINRR